MSEKFGERHIFQTDEPGEEGTGSEPKERESLQSLETVWQLPDPSVDLTWYSNPEGWVPSIQVEQIIPGTKPEADDQALKKFEKMETPRTETLIWHIDEQDFREFLKSFQDTVVVDLGAGQDPNGHLIAAAGGAKAYIGVEPNHEEYLRKSLFGRGGRRTREHNVPTIPAAVVKSDALSFLKRLPDESVSVFVSGLDNYIIDDSTYIREVEKEIARVLSPKGAFISWDSVFRVQGENLQTEVGAPESMYLDMPQWLTKTTKTKPPEGVS